MSEDQTPQPAEQDETQQRGTLNLRSQNASTSYANLALITTTPEEVVLNFGVNITPVTQAREVNVEVTDRIIMTYPSAKRLAVTLSNVIQRYESQRGVIDLGRQASAAPAPGDAR